MVGSAILRQLRIRGYKNVIVATRSLLDLVRQSAVEQWFKNNNFDVVIDCAAKVGGIHSNNVYRAEFIYSNLQIQNNLIHCSYQTKVKKLLFLGSSCIYPKFADQPIKEEYLLASPLEYTNEPYAVSKIAGIKMCESYYKQYGCDFISVMPCNQYGPNDNFHPKNSHVLPALLRRFHEAKVNKSPSLKVWGTGKARREFMHVDDLANACMFILENTNATDVYNSNISHLNVGSGDDCSIDELVKTIKKVVQYEGEVEFDLTKPDGTLKKLMDSSRLRKMGWKPQVELESGIRDTYGWYLQNEESIRSI
jgi:GDP-L-fucose synthase